MLAINSGIIIPFLIPSELSKRFYPAKGAAEKLLRQGGSFIYQD
jgi:hypothetical protein